MKPGPKPKNNISTEWSPNFAYAVGLFAADGCLSKDGRHLDFTSKDKAQVLLFKKCLGLTSKVSPKFSGSGNLSYHTQVGNVLFCQFLKSIGLTPAKSKTIESVSIPAEYFFDFLRGYFDGDGTSYSYYDPTFPKSFRFYISFISASPTFLDWLRTKLNEKIQVKGYISRNRNNSYVQLKYSKKEAIQISKQMYYSERVPCLRRKHLKIKQSLRIINGRRSGEIGRHATFRS